MSDTEARITEGRGKLYGSILDTIGDLSLIHI